MKAHRWMRSFARRRFDLPQQFRTIDYVKDRSRFGGSDAQSTFHSSTASPPIARGVATEDGRQPAEQAATLKRLAKAAYELDAFNPHSPDDILITATSAAIQI